jgi:hypothetical protein
MLVYDQVVRAGTIGKRVFFEFSGSWLEISQVPA